MTDSGTAGASGSIGFFFARAVGWFLLFTVIWMQVSAWTSYPVAAITHVVLGNNARDWVRAVHKEPGRIEVDTRIVVKPPPDSHGRGVAELVAELVAEEDPAHYAYGLPLYLALLVAAGSKHRLRRALAGYFLLLVPQALSLIFSLLKQMMSAAAHPAALGVAQWQLEGIALGYQAGALLLPTLAPIAVWLWLDKEYFAAVIVSGFLNRVTGER